MTELECPKCHGHVRQSESVDSYAFCDICKKFVYVGNQFTISDTKGVVITGLKKKGSLNHAKKPTHCQCPRCQHDRAQSKKWRQQHHTPMRLEPDLNIHMSFSRKLTPEILFMDLEE